MNRSNISLKIYSSSKFSTNERQDAILNAIWIIDCAVYALKQSYFPNATRLEEMKEIRKKLFEQIKSQLNENEMIQFEERLSI